MAHHRRLSILKCPNLGRGFGLALVTVLWLISLLTVIATIVMTVEHNQALLVQRSIETTEAETASDSAIRVRLAEIAYPPSGAAINDLMQKSTTVDEHVVSVDVQLEASRIDINVADADLLTAFFAANGIEITEAKRFAARIIDWRDSDDVPGIDGAEESAYREAGLSYGPRNASFEAVDEIRQVLGLSKLTDSLLDALTTYTHVPPIVSQQTRPSVLQALQWADARSLGGHRWLPDSWASNSEASSFIGQVVRVRACLTSVSRMVCRVAVVRLTGNRNLPFHILLWRSA